jgi:hypothetical protein
MGAVLGAGLTVVEPQLEDVVNADFRRLKIELNCCKIGILTAVDYTTMTATVQLCAQRTMRDGTYQVIRPLEDVPLVTLQGGGYSVQIPVGVGDTALVLFADGNIDNWFTGGGVAPAADGRLHALSDAVAIVGLNSLATPLGTAPSATEARLIDKAGTTKVGISGGKATVQNATQNLGTLLGQLVAYLAALNTAIAGESAVIPGAAATASGQEAAIAALTTALGELLY